MTVRDFTIKGWEKLIRKFWDKWFGNVDHFDPRCYNLYQMTDCRKDEDGNDIHFLYAEEISEEEMAKAFGVKVSAIKKFWDVYEENRQENWDVMEDHYRKAWFNVYNEKWGGTYTKRVDSDELEDMIDRHHIDFSDYDKIIVEQTENGLKIICS